MCLLCNIARVASRSGLRLLKIVSIVDRAAVVDSCSTVEVGSVTVGLDPSCGLAQAIGESVAGRSSSSPLAYHSGDNRLWTRVNNNTLAIVTPVLPVMILHEAGVRYTPVSRGNSDAAARFL